MWYFEEGGVVTVHFLYRFCSWLWCIFVCNAVIQPMFSSQECARALKQHSAVGRLWRWLHSQGLDGNLDWQLAPTINTESDEVHYIGFVVL